MKTALAAALVVITAASGAIAAPALIAPDDLDRGADAIVIARVTEVVSRWNVDRDGMTTTVTLAVESIDKGATAAVITIEQPGGEVDGARHVIVGMPVYAPGERARLHLRRLDRQRYRVYGWAQGKATLSPGAPTPFFAHNGMQWQPAQIPIGLLFHQDGSDDLDVAVARAAVFRAVARWQDVPCSTLTFVDMGDTDLAPAIDADHVITWIESDWIYGEEAAGATSLFFAPGQTPTADIALNGEHFSWADSVPSVGPLTQDIEGVMTHELGHFVGLGHTDRALDTMYFSWTPWQSQRSLSADDKLGLCALYPAPAAVDECDDEGDCDAGALCESFPSGRLCSPQPDPLGAPCDNNRVECDGFCLYSNINLTSGYCSRFCDELDCPPGFECQSASAGGNPVRVCFRAPACDDESPCAEGRFCGDDNICTFECREDIDCPTGGTCAVDGRCEAPPPEPDSGCGCTSTLPGSGLDGGLALIVIALGLAITRRRRRGT